LKVQEGGLAPTKYQFTGDTLGLEESFAEPNSVQWLAFGHAGLPQQIMRLVRGFGWIFLAFLVWTFVFYVPYAWSVFSFNYENGAQPPFIFSIAFTMVVVIGNGIMYQVCALVAEDIGFRFRDNRESCYMILYTVACMFNVALDMVLTYYFAFKVMTGLDFRTYDGTRLEDVPTFTERFETYAMQRYLAENTKAYSFPATFLIPFLLEPFITVIVPYRLGKVILRSHPELRGFDAECWITPFDFDMGRYADVILNMFLGILMFYFPGGYTLLMMFGMAGSHAYIYCFDHYRVLRAIPSCNYVTMDVDWWAQWMMIPCCSCILSCLVFKGNCQTYGYCIKGWTLIQACTFAWIAHLVLHTLFLLFVIPLFKLKEEDCPDKNPNMTYEDCSKKLACNWFSSNPVHCARSMYLEGKDEVMFYGIGKDHLQIYNPKTGCYYKEDEKQTLAEYENDSFLEDAKRLHHEASSHLHISPRKADEAADKPADGA
jgi:hypothetical protein